MCGWLTDCASVTTRSHGRGFSTRWYCNAAVYVTMTSGRPIPYTLIYHTGADKMQSRSARETIGGFSFLLHVFPRLPLQHPPMANDMAQKETCVRPPDWPNTPVVCTALYGTTETECIHKEFRFEKSQIRFKRNGEKHESLAKRRGLFASISIERYIPKIA